MSRKALKVLVEINIRGVSCPGVRLMACEDIYLSVCFMGQFRQTQCLPAVFPLLFHEKMTFEKIFRYAVDPGDIAVMLEYETVRTELMQLIPPVGMTLAYYTNDARRFLFPEPKLVPPFSGTEQEILMTRSQNFPGIICPRLEFSTATTIFECAVNAEIIDYPNVPLRPFMRRPRRCSCPRISSPQRRPCSVGRRRSAREDQGISRARSVSPVRGSNNQRLAHLSLDSDQDPASSPQHGLSSRAGARSASPHLTSRLASLTVSRSPSTVRFASPDPRQSFSNGQVEEAAYGDLNLQDSFQSIDLSPPLLSATSRRSASSSHIMWEEVQGRVRGLLTTPKAVHRLAYGVTNVEVDEVLARRSISPGLPT
ncbi:spermatogenesis associated 6-like protein [Periophthalmus magnuspinnatus]|uniref:spermatogenesis associated 6-like protein n=1 Tax=Periophthalmus magnuspinnatus TaxID=409849 RepID=UPI002436758B|nr:spermatogenesis associated 6-like protein [Periophthalmus magnuspinnatus]